ncbi:MAG TPA: fused MFS/spermidine synthase [Chloroflexota bacterium]|nr:fused MFS/spermidine synthase [Chloroflexota bacterium]
MDGVVQSVHVDSGPLGPGYWPLMLPEAHPRTALILGLGGGTIAHLLRKRFGAVRIVGVDNDPAIIRIARSAFSIERCTNEIVEADAFAFVDRVETVFDYIAVDLFADGMVPPAIFRRPFLRRIRQALAPGGIAAFNFFNDRRTAARVDRLKRTFPRVALLKSRENVVAHCRPR